MMINYFVPTQMGETEKITIKHTKYYSNLYISPFFSSFFRGKNNKEVLVVIQQTVTNKGIYIANQKRDIHLSFNTG